jgi:hypothetical protein
MVRWVVIAALVVGVGALGAYAWPDVRRYMKIRRM